MSCRRCQDNLLSMLSVAKRCGTQSTWYFSRSPSLLYVTIVNEKRSKSLIVWKTASICSSYLLPRIHIISKTLWTLLFRRTQKLLFLAHAYHYSALQITVGGLVLKLVIELQVFKFIETQELAVKILFHGSLLVDDPLAWKQVYSML